MVRAPFPFATLTLAVATARMNRSLPHAPFDQRHRVHPLARENHRVRPRDARVQAKRPLCRASSEGFQAARFATIGDHTKAATVVFAINERACQVSAHARIASQNGRAPTRASARSPPKCIAAGPNFALFFPPLFSPFPFPNGNCTKDRNALNMLRQFV